MRLDYGQQARKNKMKLLLLPIILLAVACGDGVNPPTIGEQTEVIATAFCESLEGCPNAWDTIEECVEWNVNNVCTTLTDCDAEATERQQIELEICLEGLGNQNCTGFVPPECISALGF